MRTGTKAILLAGTHAIVLAIGFAGGIYTLPILIAPPPPSAAEVQVAADEAVYSATFIVARALSHSVRKPSP